MSNEHKDHEHYEEVNGMRQGHGKIPKVLIFVYSFLGVWAVIYAMTAGPLDDRKTFASGAGGVSAEAGKALSTQCLACHGQGLKGGVGPTLVGVVDKLSPDGVKQVLKNGRNAMPALGASWSDDQMGSMVEYLKTLK
ncbi:MAG TPA: cytochrome c [Bacillota bacterium]|nr:cytochrome c [Bacillota bacterium]